MPGVGAVRALTDDCGVPARPLLAGLPEQCQEDLELLQSTIRALKAGRDTGEATPPDRFRAVFLTGATGFIGRFVLRDLLQQNGQLVVHCLVRAEDPAQGMDRIRQALQFWRGDPDLAGVV